MKTALKLLFCYAFLALSTFTFGQDTKKQLLGTWVSTTEKVLNGENVIAKETWTFANDTIYTLSENISASSKSKGSDKFAYTIKGQNIQFNMWGVDGKIEIVELTENKLSGNFIISNMNKKITFIKGNE